MLKIARDGSVSDSADVPDKPFFERLADVNEAVAEANADPAALDAEAAGTETAPADPEGESFTVEGGSAGASGLEVLKVPAEGAKAEAAPVAPPVRTPPRRAAPPGAPDA
jgi:hypothetical protein